MPHAAECCDRLVGRTLNSDTTLCVVVEMSLSSWLVAGLVPGVKRRPLNKMCPDEVGLFSLVERWRAEAADNGRAITRIVLAYEARRDGFWLARCAEHAALRLTLLMRAASLCPATLAENRRRARPHSHDVNCRPRTQAPHCIVAHDKDGRGSRRGLRPAARGRIVPDGPLRAVLS